MAQRCTHSGGSDIDLEVIMKVRRGSGGGGGEVPGEVK